MYNISRLGFSDWDPGCLSRIRFFSIPDPESRVDKIPDPDPHQRSFNQETDAKFSKIRSGMFIPDPGSWL
jgi:hypothetical protein